MGAANVSDLERRRAHWLERVAIAVAGIVIGLVLGFWLGATETPIANAPPRPITAREQRSDPSPPQAELPPLPTRATVEPPANDRAAPAPAESAQAMRTQEDRVPDGMIRGVVVDSAGRPIPYAEISADLASAERLPGEPVLDQFDLPAPWHVRTIATHSGRFALGGLRAASEYFVRTQYGSLVRADIARDWRVDDRHIVAPADDLLLTLTQCRLEIELLDPRGRDVVPGAVIVTTVQGAGPDRFEGNAERLFTIAVPPDRAVRLEVRAKGLRPTVLEGLVVARAEAIKHVAVPLTLVGSGAVCIAVQNGLGRPVSNVWFDDVTDAQHPTSITPDGATSSSALGTFVISDVTAGLHAISVRGAVEDGLIPTRVDVEAIDSREVRATAVLHHGGRLRLSVKAKNDAFAQTRVFRAGAQVSGRFRDEHSRQDIGDQLVGGQRYLFEHGLEPGDYVVRWRRGSISTSRNEVFRSLGGPSGELPFTISAGEIADLELKLD